MSCANIFINCFLVLLTCIAPKLLADEELEREYWYCSEELNNDREFADLIIAGSYPDEKLEERCQATSSTTFCAKHYGSATFSGINENLLSQIPPLPDKCLWCNNKAIYFGYIDPRFKRYSSHVIRQIKYSISNTECSCYWPELSMEAAEINDLAFRLFDTLVESTALAKMLEDDSMADEFRNTAFSSYSTDNPIPFFIARQFRFSHYHRLANDLEFLAAKYFSGEEFYEIKDDLQTILKELSFPFVCLYEDCLEKHPNEEIKQELEFTKLFLPDLDDDNDDEEWEIEREYFYNKPSKVREYLNRLRPTDKKLRQPVLNISPLFHFHYNELFPLEGRDKACFKIFKNLMYELYKDQEFYKEVKDTIPDFEDQFLKKLISEAKIWAANGKVFSKASYLAKFELDNELMSYTRYKMFQGSNSKFWLWRQEQNDSYYSLVEFISLSSKSGYLASIWLAPRPLLIAIFEDETLADDIVKTREEIFQALQDGDDSLVVRDELRKRYSDKLGDIDPKFIDFRINRQHPYTKS